MDKQIRLPSNLDRDLYIHSTGSSYYYDIEDLVRIMIGSAGRKIDESAEIIARMTDEKVESSYKNKNEFLMHSF